MTRDDITPEATFMKRRELLKNAAFFAGASAAMSGALWALTKGGGASIDIPPGEEMVVAKRGEYLVNENVTPYESVTTYNNYYELGLAKNEPAQRASTLKPLPWTIRVTGAVAQEQTLDVEALIKRVPLEERVYRFRCVEAWSMVVPWLGFPLKGLVDLAQPLANAKYVVFETLNDPEQLPGLKTDVLQWPYQEGLRIDEATHPLALMVVGVYGRVLPNQNGAPIRLIVPWKYGFKSIKSIVRMHFQEQLPATTWNRAAANEYGFYGNVNPAVDHPRWSQATERRIGELSRRPTLPFNGYADQVASLYMGMDLKVNF